MSDRRINLRAIAEAHVDEPLNKWPDHTAAHERTLMGAFLIDYNCLRCHLEMVATERIKEAKEKRSGE